MLNKLFFIQKAHAQLFTVDVDHTTGPDNFTELVDIFVSIVRVSLPIIVGLALLVFLIGLVRFISSVSKGDEKGVADGKKLIVWGLIALFILVAFIGILSFFYSDIGFIRPFGIPLLPEDGGGISV